MAILKASRSCIWRYSLISSPSKARAQWILSCQFHGSGHLAAVKPFLLADIGEGIFYIKAFQISIPSLHVVRYQRGTDHPMVRPTRSSGGAIR